MQIRKTVLLSAALGLMATSAPNAHAQNFNVRNDTLISCYNAVGNVTIPRNLGIKVIGSRAFNPTSDAYTALTGVVIPEGVTSISDYAFFQCQGLQSITWPSTLKTIGGNAFEYCSGLTTITFPDNLTYIGQLAFEACYGLTNVNIPRSVKTIGHHAFAYCYHLTTVTIGDGLETIDYCAFFRCTTLQTLILGAGVKTIGVGNFYDCNSLYNLYVCAVQPPEIQLRNTFYPDSLAPFIDIPRNDIPHFATLHVPQGALEAYRNIDTTWTTWPGIILDDIPIVHDTIHLNTTYINDTAYIAKHDTIHDTTYIPNPYNPNYIHTPIHIHDTTVRDSINYRIRRITTTLTDTLRDTTTLPARLQLDTSYIFTTTRTHTDTLLRDTTWHTADATDTATVLFYDTTHTPVDAYDTTRTTLVLVDPTLPPVHLLLHDTTFYPYPTDILYYLLLDPLDDIGTGISIAPSNETRASDIGGGILLEGLTPHEAFAIYSLDGLLLLRATAPTTGAYLLHDLAGGTYLLYHAGHWFKFVHK